MTQDVGTDPTVCLPGCCLLCGQVITCYLCGDVACIQFRGRIMEEMSKENLIDNPEDEAGAFCQARGKEDLFKEESGEESTEEQISHPTQGHSTIMC